MAALRLPSIPLHRTPSRSGRALTASGSGAVKAVPEPVKSNYPTTEKEISVMSKNENAKRLHLRQKLISAAAMAACAQQVSYPP